MSRLNLIQGLPHEAMYSKSKNCTKNTHTYNPSFSFQVHLTLPLQPRRPRKRKKNRRDYHFSPTESGSRGSAPQSCHRPVALPAPNHRGSCPAAKAKSLSLLPLLPCHTASYVVLKCRCNLLLWVFWWKEKKFKVDKIQRAQGSHTVRSLYDKGKEHSFQKIRNMMDCILIASVL